MKEQGNILCADKQQGVEHDYRTVRLKGGTCTFICLCKYLIYLCKDKNAISNTYCLFKEWNGWLRSEIRYFSVEFSETVCILKFLNELHVEKIK